MVFKGDEGLILVILPGYVGAELAKTIQLLLELLGRDFDIGPDSSDILIMVHLGASISDDLDVFGQELVAILRMREGWSEMRLEL